MQRKLRNVPGPTLALLAHGLRPDVATEDRPFLAYLSPRLQAVKEEWTLSDLERLCAVTGLDTKLMSTLNKRKTKLEAAVLQAEEEEAQLVLAAN
jgi:hypothetical protein